MTGGFSQDIFAWIIEPMHTSTHSSISTEAGGQAEGEDKTPLPIPSSHLDLIDGPYTVALTTITPDGYPHTTPVWCNRKGDHILINVMRGYRKERNMSLNPHISILVWDPKDPLRNLEVRGCVVEMTETGALEHNDELAQLYMNKPDARFFGDCVPLELRARFTPVKVTILPTRVRVEAGKK